MVFVAMDADRRPTAIPAWEPDTDDERAHKASALRHIELRKNIETLRGWFSDTKVSYWAGETVDKSLWTIDVVVEGHAPAELTRFIVNASGDAVAMEHLGRGKLHQTLAEEALQRNDFASAAVRSAMERSGSPSSSR